MMLVMMSGRLGRSVWWQLSAVLIIILLMKATFLALDATPSFFYGDSQSYLTVATLRWIPPDRSFLYGLLIRKIAFKTHSLNALIYLQVACSSVAAWLLCFGLYRILRTRFSVAAAMGLLCAIEPFQLLMERYVMTEAASNFLFALHFVLLLGYLRNGRLWVLAAAQTAGVVLIGIRISFLPEVLINSVLVPLLSPPAFAFYRSLKTSFRRRFNGIDWWRLNRLAMHLVLSVMVSQALLAQYAHWYGRLEHRAPALNYESGAYLIADFAPLILKQDLPADSRREATFARVTIDTRDPGLRVAQHFADGGLWHAIQAEYPDPAQADRVALKTVEHALLRNPLGALRLAAGTYAEYFNRKEMQSDLLTDEGAGGQLSADVKQWLITLYGVKDPQSYKATLTKSWHQWSLGWCWVILLALVASPALLMIVQRDQFPFVLVMIVTASIFLAGVTLLVERPIPRYLTTPAWMILLMFGVAIHAAISRWRRDRMSLQRKSQPAALPQRVVLPSA